MTQLHLLDWLFPYPCCSCADLRPVSQLGLCSSCQAALTPTPRRVCLSCGRPLPPRSHPDARCVTCSASPPAIDRLVTVWSYQPPIDAVLAALKFSRRSFLAEGLADAAWHHHAEVLASNDLITAIPLTWNRRLTRGFNQSELLARRLAGRLDLPYTALLRRSGRGVQSRSNKLLRRVNVSKAFRVRKRKLADLDRSAILLVDDVVTTGATLEAAARSLLAAGASRVTALAIVRTPEERRS